MSTQAGREQIERELAAWVAWNQMIFARREPYCGWPTCPVHGWQ